MLLVTIQYYSYAPLDSSNSLISWDSCKKVSFPSNQQMTLKTYCHKVLKKHCNTSPLVCQLLLSARQWFRCSGMILKMNLAKWKSFHCHVPFHYYWLDILNIQRKTNNLKRIPLYMKIIFFCCPGTCQPRVRAFPFHRMGDGAIGNWFHGPLGWRWTLWSVLSRHWDLKLLSTLSEQRQA